MNESRQIDTKTTKQIRMDAGLHMDIKTAAAMHGISIKQLIEGLAEEYLAEEGTALGGRNEN